MVADSQAKHQGYTILYPDDVTVDKHIFIGDGRL